MVTSFQTTAARRINSSITGSCGLRLSTGDYRAENARTIGNTMKLSGGLRLSSILNLLHVAAATKVPKHPRGPTCCRWQTGGEVTIIWERHTCYTFHHPAPAERLRAYTNLRMQTTWLLNPTPTQDWSSLLSVPSVSLRVSFFSSDKICQLNDIV